MLGRPALESGHNVVDTGLPASEDVGLRRLSREWQPVSCSVDRHNPGTILDAPPSGHELFALGDPDTANPRSGELPCRSPDRFERLLQLLGRAAGAASCR
jgi:hypothetical protein